MYVLLGMYVCVHIHGQGRPSGGTERIVESIMFCVFVVSVYIASHHDIFMQSVHCHGVSRLSYIHSGYQVRTYVYIQVHQCRCVWSCRAWSGHHRFFLFVTLHDSVTSEWPFVFHSAGTLEVVMCYRVLWGLYIYFVY